MLLQIIRSSDLRLAFPTRASWFCFYPNFRQRLIFGCSQTLRMPNGKHENPKDRLLLIKKTRAGSSFVLSMGLTRHWQLGALLIAWRCSTRRAPVTTEMKATGLTGILVSS